MDKINYKETTAVVIYAGGLLPSGLIPGEIIPSGCIHKGKEKGRKKYELKNREIYDIFVNWLLTFDLDKEIKTQGEFSKIYNISQRTLSQWKYKPETKKIIKKAMDDWVADKGISIKKAHYKNAIEGNPALIKLWYQYFDGWSEKSEIKLGGDISVDVKVNNIYDKMTNEELSAEMKRQKILEKMLLKRKAKND